MKLMKGFYLSIFVVILVAVFIAGCEKSNITSNNDVDVIETKRSMVNPYDYYGTMHNEACINSFEELGKVDGSTFKSVEEVFVNIYEPIMSYVETNIGELYIDNVSDYSVFINNIRGKSIYQMLCENFDKTSFSNDFLTLIIDFDQILLKEDNQGFQDDLIKLNDRIYMNSNLSDFEREILYAGTSIGYHSYGLWTGDISFAIDNFVKCTGTKCNITFNQDFILRDAWWAVDIVSGIGGAIAGSVIPGVGTVGGAIGIGAGASAGVLAVRILEQVWDLIH